MRPTSIVKILSPLLSLATIPAFASPEYLGLYMQSHKVGYSSYQTTPVTKNGAKLTESATHTLMDLGLLGTPLTIQMDSQTYLDGNDSPVEMDFQTTSKGRTQKIEAKFGATQVQVSVDNSGNLSKITLARPKGSIVDDPINMVLLHHKETTCYVLDPTTVSFVENTVRVVGTKKETVDGKPIDETIIELIDPRATTRAYVDPSGKLLRAEGPMGVVMMPVTEAVALEKPAEYSADVDLAYSTSIVPTGNLDDPATTKSLKLQLEGRNLGKLPSDESQTVSGSGDSWTISIHPPRLEKGISIQEAKSSKASWTKPDLDIPSASSTFKSLAKQITAGKPRTTDAALAIKSWVYEHMKANAGIGVLRDASEILKTKEGVCRDYAILTATLMRSAGIPTRLASGLVSWDGTFYYHAWDEIWDGHHWLGIDSTTPDRQISAAHVKLAEGSVADAFTFAVLDHVKIKILSSER